VAAMSDEASSRVLVLNPGSDPPVESLSPSLPPGAGAADPAPAFSNLSWLAEIPFG
jgi:hypothetical protein